MDMSGLSSGQQPKFYTSQLQNILHQLPDTVFLGIDTTTKATVQGQKMRSFTVLATCLSTETDHLQQHFSLNSILRCLGTRYESHAMNSRTSWLLEMQFKSVWCFTGEQGTSCLFLKTQNMLQACIKL